MNASDDAPEPAPPPTSPPTTLWTQIVQAQAGGTQAEQAWQVLVKRYERPILAQIRRHFRDDPENLAAEFMAEKFVFELVPKADPRRGRFRGLLAQALRFFIISRLRKLGAEKRGEGNAPLPLDTALLEAHAAAASADQAFERELDREFALEVHGRAVASVRAAFLAQGTEEEFELLIGRDADLPLREIALRLHLSEEAVKVRRHRLLKKLPAAFLAEVEEMVGPDQVDAELQYLQKVLMQGATDPGQRG